MYRKNDFSISQFLSIILIICIFSVGTFYLGQASARSRGLVMDCSVYTGEIYTISYSPNIGSYITFTDHAGLFLKENIIDIISTGKTYTIFYSNNYLIGYRCWN